VTTPTAFAAFAAGLLTFASPCVLPLLPGFLAYMSGHLAAPDAPRSTMRASAVAAGFVGGFTIVFVALGATASGAGTLLVRHRALFERVGGAAIVLMGLFVLGVARLPLLFREFRLHPEPPPGVPGSMLLGGAFALGWSPCIGPTLAAVLAVAAGQGDGSALAGGALLAVYSAGLGAPFVLLVATSARSTAVIRTLRRRGRLVNGVGGLLLVVLGTLMATGQFALVSSAASRGA
jgi:cytochrome c-type biogenesis protein